MRFIQVHKVASYLLVLTSTAALVFSGELNPIVNALMFGAIAVSWYWEPPRVDPQRFTLLWNGVTVLALLRTIFAVVTGDWIIHSGVYFIDLLMVVKLFTRSTSRDYLQIYVLSFLQMVAGTTLNTGITYGAFFFLYIVFATWTLILFHLKREMEENYLLKYGDSLTGRPVQVERVLNSRKLVGGRFLAATSVVSIVVFTLSVAGFFLFPRVGFGLFFKKQRAGITMAGFSDRIELGTFGTIKDDPTVVMRVELDGDPNQRPSLPYWRGISFDRYDGTTWTKSRPGLSHVPQMQGEVFVVGNRQAPDEPIAQSIYLEPMDTPVLFGLPDIWGVSLYQPGPDILAPPRRVRVDVDGDVHYNQRDDIAFRYRVLSDPAEPHPGVLDRELEAYVGLVRKLGTAISRYTQLPGDLDPRIPALARELAGDARTVREAVGRIEGHLRKAYGYTLDLKRDPRFAPLSDFLFVQRQGHCEYFSTAMVIMLRSLGIPARSVNGFYGGTWNPYGGYLAVRQGDAHSWVEVWLPGGRWWTRDPTPSGASARAQQNALMNNVLQYVDALRLRWYKYVIEYDLQKQLGGLLELQKVWRSVFGAGPSLGGRPDAASDGGGPAAPGRPWLLLVAAVLVGLAIFAMRRRVPRKGGWGGPAPSPQADAVVALYQQLGTVYGRLGHARPAAATAREYLDLLRSRDAPGIETAAEVVSLYEAVRFGGEAAEMARIEALGKAVRSLPEAARARPAA